MKAFVIKNKEGKYFDKESMCFCSPDYVCCEHIYYTIDDAKHHIDYYGLKDCEVVEITIAEGNLEQENKHLKRLLDAKEKIETNSIKRFEKLQQENKQLKEQHDLLIDDFQKERENLCKQIKQESDARERFVEKVKQLKERLVEKDKEIEQLRKNMEFDTAYYIKELVNIRKQVCEEIYNFIMSNWEELMGMQGRWQNFNGTCLDLKEDLQQIAENGYEKENKDEH